MPNPRTRNGLDRRQFLARMGVLGAATVVGWRPTAAGASTPEPVGGLLREVARDTINGLVAFVVPGPDLYSLRQGVTTAEAGGVDADTTDFMLDALDSFVPLHDQLVGPLVRSLATGLSDGAARTGTPLVLPRRLTGLLDNTVHTLDEALAPLLTNDVTLPISEVIALLLNTMATWVDPTSVAGPFPTAPFANLSFANKAEAFRRMEEDTTEVAATLDRDLPEPLRGSLAGLLSFVPGALLEFVAFGTYSEWSTADRATRQLSGVPVGWRLSGYLDETGYRPVEGWDDLQGYYAGRRSADR